MATEIICIVDTDATQNPDYTSLSAALIGEAGADPKCVTSSDLVANNEQLTIECRASNGDEDTTQAFVDGFTTNEDCYINIITPLNHRHNGKWSDNKYRIICTANWLGVIHISNDYTRVDGIQIENTAIKTDNPYGVRIYAATSGTITRVSNCIIKSTGADVGIFNAGIIQSVSCMLYAWNNIIYGFGRGFNTVYLSGSGNGQIAYNNTIIDCDVYGLRAEGASTCEFRWINNIVQNSGTQDYMLDMDGGTLDYSANNISSDNSSPNTSFRSLNVSFIDDENEDYRLAANDTIAKDEGVDLSEDNYIPFNTDLIETIRPQGLAWDIGAFEYIFGSKIKHRIYKNSNIAISGELIEDGEYDSSIKFFANGDIGLNGEINELGDLFSINLEGINCTGFIENISFDG